MISSMKKKKIKDIVAVYKKKSCNVSATCDSLGISRNTFYEWKRKDQNLSDALGEAEESMLDWAETKLLEAINDNNLTALIFFLKTKGKKRGYVEQVDQNFVKNPFEELMKELPDEDDDESE